MTQPMSPRLRLPAALLLSLPCLMAVGCGWLVGEIAEQAHKQSAIEDHVYKDVEPDQLWREINELWVAQGCQKIPEPVLATTVECEGGAPRWVRVDARDGGYHVEFEVEQTLDAEAYDVKEGESPPKPGRERDFDMEWTLLERLDYPTAKAIAAEAEAKGAKARDATRELDKSFD